MERPVPYRVSRDYRITIDRAIRAQLGVRPGMVAVQQAVEGQLVITFIPAPHRRSAAGILGKSPRNAGITWEQARELAEISIAEDAIDGV
jgi:hypothetical protein